MGDLHDLVTASAAVLVRSGHRLCLLMGTVFGRRILSRAYHQLLRWLAARCSANLFSVAACREYSSIHLRCGLLLRVFILAVGCDTLAPLTVLVTALALGGR